MAYCNLELGPNHCCCCYLNNNLPFKTSSDLPLKTLSLSLSSPLPLSSSSTYVIPLSLTFPLFVSLSVSLSNFLCFYFIQNQNVGGQFLYIFKFIDRVPYFSYLTKSLFSLILQIWQVLLFLDTVVTIVIVPFFLPTLFGKRGIFTRSPFFCLFMYVCKGFGRIYCESYKMHCL